MFEYSLTMWGQVLKIVAYKIPPINAKRYDFFVDGVSFFSMPKLRYLDGSLQSYDSRANGDYSLEGLTPSGGGFTVRDKIEESQEDVADRMDRVASQRWRLRQMLRRRRRI
jgi:hypothetical protein